MTDQKIIKSELLDKLKDVSTGPGVYLMKDDQEVILYVGKAGNLKNRLTTYFTSFKRLDLKTSMLVMKIDTFDTILTASANEALILESSLIKRYHPRYNVILKDDKRYPFLRLNKTDPFPRLQIVRRVKKDGAFYFGPYTSGMAVQRTIKFIHKTFKLRKCKTIRVQKRSRPCINYQMGTCLAPCCMEVDQQVYGEIVKEVILFLKGRTPALLKHIKTRMYEAANALEYEKASVFRDKLQSLEAILEKQISVITDFKDRDVLAITGTIDCFILTLLIVRGGFLMGSRHFHFNETLFFESALMESFIRQYYEKNSFIPSEILVSHLPEDLLLLTELLSKLKEKKITIICPLRGEKADLIKMARQNADSELQRVITINATSEDLLRRLKKSLQMKTIPWRIECFDNSNLGGKQPVAGMVVFEKGRPLKQSYRKYIIKTVKIPDDYAYMKEILSRRYGKGAESMPFPDLLMVDGGKGQLNIALSVIRELDLEGKFAVIGIAKKNKEIGEVIDKIYKPLRSNPVNFGSQGDLLLFLQRVRDEAHRFAISFHRQRRNKKTLESSLNSISGVGKKRKAMLLKHFGSIKKIRAATPEELSAVPGISSKTARAISHYYKVFTRSLSS